MWGGDLSRHVETSVEGEPEAVPCEGGGSSVRWWDAGRGRTHADVVRLVTGKAFEAFAGAGAAGGDAVQPENESEVRRRVEAERRRWERMSEQQRKVDKHRRHVVEGLLTLKCPRCGQAYVDFNGCCALTCSRAGAGQACLLPKGLRQRRPRARQREQCNDHGLFPDEGVLDGMLRDKRQRAVSGYIGGQVEEELRGEVLRFCAADLRDVGVQLAGMGGGVEAGDEGGEAEGGAVERLMEMGGWSAEDAQFALEAAEGDVEIAAEMLMG